ncbi:hypothetical protein PQO03_19185 [Lentisphaera profundi]|uniref:Uncharacterized protein n=1 Tax=Lentisphaera profundi TaxID=1658616 RepID=A0ABY7VVZ9_9BACT|nr:hypothetical protein [Lentisphaera profundi]WDE97954.1 hypothetical protein PQO03_19185 [Lentisphaera profundi]
MKTLVILIFSLCLSADAFWPWSQDNEKIANKLSISELKFKIAEQQLYTDVKYLVSGMKGHEFELASGMEAQSFSYHEDLEITKKKTTYWLKLKKNVKAQAYFVKYQKAALLRGKDYRVDSMSLPAQALRPFELHYPKVLEKLHFNNTLLEAERLREHESEKIYSGALPLQKFFSFAWAEKAVAVVDSKALDVVKVKAQVTLVSGALQYDLQYDWSVINGKRKMMRLELPANFVLTNFAAENFEAKEEEIDGARYLLIYGDEAQNEIIIKLKGELTVDQIPANYQILLPLPQKVLKSSGFLRVNTSIPVKIIPEKSEGLIRVEHKQNKGTYLYSYPSLPVKLDLKLKEISPIVDVNTFHDLVVNENEVRHLSSFKLDIREAALSEIKFLIKGDFIPVVVKGVTSYEIENMGTHKVLHARLAEVKGSHNISIEQERAVSSWEESLVYPSVTCLNVRSERGVISTAATKGFSIDFIESKGLLRLPKDALAQRLKGQLSTWRFRKSGWETKFKVEKLKPRISAEALHMYSIGENTVYVSALFTMKISAAPSNSIRLYIPATIKNPEITGDHRPQLKKIADEEYEVSLNKRIMGDYNLLLSYDFPATLKGLDLDCGEVSILNAESENGYITLSGANTIRSGAFESLDSVFEIEENQLPEAYRILHSNPLIRLFRYTAAPHRVKVKVQTLEDSELMGNVVSSSAIKSALTEDGSISHKAIFMLRNRNKQFLSVRLPKESNLGRCKVEGVQVRPIADGEFLMIPLKRNTDPNKPLKVEMNWTEKKNPLTKDLELSLQGPSLDAVSLHSEWELSLPQSYLLSDIDSNILPQGHYERGGGLDFLGKCKMVLSRINYLSLLVVSLLCFALNALPALKGRLSFLRVVLVLTVFFISLAYFSSVKIMPQRGMAIAQEVYTFRGTSLKEMASPYIKSSISNVNDQPVAGKATLKNYIYLLLALTALVLAFIKRWGICLGFSFVCFGLGVQNWQVGEFVFLISLPLILCMGVAMFMGRWAKYFRLRKVVNALLLLLFCSVGQGLEAKTHVSKELRSECLIPIVQSKIFSDVEVDVELKNLEAEMKVDVKAQLRGLQGDRFDLIPVFPSHLSIDRAVSSPTIEDLSYDKSLAEIKLNASGAMVLLLKKDVKKLEFRYSYRIKAAHYSKESKARLKNEKAYFTELINFNWGFLPRASVRRVTLSLAGADWSAKSSYAIPSENKEGLSVFTLPGIFPTTFQRERLDKELTKPDFYVEQEVLLMAEEGLLSVEQEISLRLTAGILPSVFLSMPQDWHLESVESLTSNKKITWDYDAKTRKLKVIFLNSESDKNLKFKIISRRTDLRLPQKVKVELARLEGARSVRGRILVASQPGVAMRVADFSNCRKLAGRPLIDIPTENESELSAWQFSSKGLSMNLQLAKVEAELDLYGDHHFHLSSSRLSLNSTLQVKVKRRGVFQLDFKLPKDYEVENVQCKNLSYWDAEKGVQDQLLSLYFDQKIFGQVQVQLRLVKIVAEIPSLAEVPRVVLLDENRHSGVLRLSAEKGFGLDIVSSESTSTSSMQEDGSQLVRLLKSNWELGLKTRKLSASTELTFMQTMRLEDDLLKGMMGVDLVVEHAPIKVLKFTSDQNLENLNIRGKNIAQLREIDKKHWELDLLSPQIGKLSFEITWQVSVKDSSLEMSSVYLDGASRQSGHLVLFAPSNVALKYEGLQGFKQIDFREFDSVRSPADLASSRACFRVFSQKRQMAIEFDEKSLADSLPAEVKSVNLTTQVGVDASQVSQLIMKMDTGTKPYLKMVLPKKSRLMNVIINGVAVRPVLRDQQILIPLKGRPDSLLQAEIELKVLYITEPEEKMNFEEFKGPAFDLPLNNIAWNLYLPEHGDYTEFSGNMKYLSSYKLTNLVSAAELVKQNSFLGRSQIQAGSRIREGLVLSKKGLNVEARAQLEKAVEESLGDKGKQEDARMQLNKLWRNQAQMAIANRRSNLVLTGKDLKFNKNYTAADVSKTVHELQDNDSAALGVIGEKIFSRQKAARKRVQPLELSLPMHGSQLEFKREMMVEKNKPLIIKLHAQFESKELEKPYGFLKIMVLLLGFIAGLLIICKPSQGLLRRNL